MLTNYSYDHKTGQVSHFGKPLTYRMSRVAWALLHNGEMPQGYIYHLNGDKKDFRSDNLCDIDIHKKPLPCRGAKWDITEQGWRVFTNKYDRMTYLGFAKTDEEACQLREGLGRTKECRQTPAYYMRGEQARLRNKIEVAMIEVKRCTKKYRELGEALAAGNILILL